MKYQQMRDTVLLTHGWAPPGQEELMIELCGRGLLGDRAAEAAALDLLLDAGMEEAAQRFIGVFDRTRKGAWRRYSYEQRIEFWSHFPGARKPRKRKRDHVAG